MILMVLCYNVELNERVWGTGKGEQKRMFVVFSSYTSLETTTRKENMFLYPPLSSGSARA